jgi:hypothetical protein
VPPRDRGAAGLLTTTSSALAALAGRTSSASRRARRRAHRRKLYFSDGSIQHAGPRLLEQALSHPFRYWTRDEAGPFGELVVNREMTGVTAACSAMRRDAFLEIGGFPEALPSNFNDVDLCYRSPTSATARFWVAKLRAVPLRVADPRRDGAPLGAALRCTPVGDPGRRPVHAGRGRHPDDGPATVLLDARLGDSTRSTTAPPPARADIGPPRPQRVRLSFAPRAPRATGGGGAVPDPCSRCFCRVRSRRSFRAWRRSSRRCRSHPVRRRRAQLDREGLDCAPRTRRETVAGR